MGCRYGSPFGHATVAGFERRVAMIAVVSFSDIAVWAAIAAVAATASWLWHRKVRAKGEQDSGHRLKEMYDLLERAECLLWEAEVTLSESDWKWNFTVHNSALARRILGGDRMAVKKRLWVGLYEVPERPEMNARARRAMEQGLSGYEQEFRLVNGATTLWLHERVSITPRGQGRFWLVGLATDRTAVGQAEAAKRRSELTVDSIMSHAEWVLWRATVVHDGEALQWTHFDVPESRLSKVLFGDRVYSRHKGFWENVEIPEQRSMDKRSTQAIQEGLPGYEQEFRVVTREGRTFWLHERVTITRVSASAWSLVGMITDVTAQHETEAARFKVETRLAFLLERADCLVWEATVKQRADGTLDWELYTQRSMLYRRIFGDRNDTDLSWHTVNVPELEEMVERSRLAVLGRARGYTQEFHVEKPDDVIWLREVVTMSEVRPGEFSLVGVVTDITGQRRAEEAQQKSELRLTALLERADCMVWQGEARIKPESDAVEWRLFTPKSALFRRLFEADPDPSRDVQFGWTEEQVAETPEMARRARHALQNDLPGYEQVFSFRKNGGVLWLNEKVAIKPVGPGHWELVGIITDITGQRGAEAALAAEKERLSVTLRAMHESVITTDVAGVVLFMNPAAAAMTGWNEAEACGQPLAAICSLANHRTEQPLELPVARVARGDVVADLPPETRLVARSNQPRLVEGCCAPIHAMDSTVIGTVLVFRDVTEQAQLEQELVRATRLESVGVLAGGIAHDFNNILTAVMGNLTLAQMDIAPDSPAAQNLRSAEKAALRARDLTQQLLTFAKGGEPVRAAVKLDGIIREMTAFALHGSQVKAHYDFALDLWPADADKGQIGRVVQNLAINAVQAMPRGGTLQIIASNEMLDGIGRPGITPGSYIKITISDSGEGIRADHLARIFDPYFTTKQTGTGLGLAAVYSIIKKHRGHIDVESKLGRGTTFRIWLPALVTDVTRPDSHSPWSPGPMRGRVLFMDDEPSIREMATALLGRFGMAVDTANDGAEAIAKYRVAWDSGRGYDLVIMDLTIPGGMGGLEALQELRKLDPEVRAIVSSGYSSDPVMSNYRNHGFVGMVAKPYEINEFARVIREVLPTR
jgi:PAS domain S-box-containing protein